MRLHVIGEAACHVDDATALTLPKIPFHDIRGMRHRIAHDYVGVNFRIVWKTVRHDLKPLIRELEKYFKQETRRTAAERHQHALDLTTSPALKQGPRISP